MPELRSPLAVDRLRRLTLDPLEHTRAQAHFSAASGLVCTFARAYVIGDDELHLAVYRDRTSVGELHRLLPGDLPNKKATRKKRKADLESLLWLPATGAMVALGSGSTSMRDRGVSINLSPDGAPRLPSLAFDLAPLYEPLRERHGPINIEGAFVLGDSVLLLNRGHPSGAGNMALSYRLHDFMALMVGDRKRALEPHALQSFDLGAIDGVALGFTDGAALPGGGWVFSAVAEDSSDSVADGACCGAVVGVVAADGQLQSLRRLTIADKIEGIDVQLQAGRLVLFMVTDADDPGQTAWLLSARL